MAAGYFLPAIGGLERYIYNLSKALLKEGANVAVVASQTPGTSLAEALEGIDIIRIPSLHVSGERLPIPRLFSSAVAAQLRVVEAWNPDVFVVHTHLFASNLLIARLARRLGKPCVLINHGSGYVAGNNSFVNAGLKLYEHALASQLRRFLVRSYGVSRASAAWLETFGIAADGVIPNGVDVSVIPERDRRMRDQLGIPDAHLLIAFAARLLPDKGADTLVSTFMAIDPPSASLAIAGDGPALPGLRESAANDPRIHFLGATKHQDVLGLFGSADVMAYPSRYPEGQPTTVLEAGAMGCAVVATPKGGTAELISSSDLGFIVEDQAGLENVLRILLADAPLRHETGRRLQQKVLAEHDWCVIGRNALTVLENVVQQYGKSEDHQ